MASPGHGVRALSACLAAAVMVTVTASCSLNAGGIFAGIFGVDTGSSQDGEDFVQGSHNSSEQSVQIPDDAVGLDSDLSSQEDISDPSVPLNDVEFKYDKAYIELGAATRLRYTPVPIDGNTSDLKWVSSAPEIISVSNRGKITANSGGVATITVYSETYEVMSTCLIYVRGEAEEPNESIEGEDGESGLIAPPSGDGETVPPDGSGGTSSGGTSSGGTSSSGTSSGGTSSGGTSSGGTSSGGTSSGGTSSSGTSSGGTSSGGTSSGGTSSGGTSSGGTSSGGTSSGGTSSGGTSSGGTSSGGTSSGGTSSGGTSSSGTSSGGTGSGGVSSGIVDSNDEDDDYDFDNTKLLNSLIRVKQPDGTFVVSSILEFVAFHTGREISSQFSDEAIRAQAVTVYTYYICYNMINGATYATSEHRELPIDPETGRVVFDSVYNKFPQRDGSFDRLMSLCASVIGQTVLYNNKPICAVFSAMNRGASQCNSPYWSSYVYPYLIRVDSPWDKDAPDYETTKTLSKADVQRILTGISPSLVLPTDPSEWFDEIERDVPDEGYVLYVTIGESSIKGSTLRSKLGLRSNCFFVEYDEDTEMFTFTVHGYGHGIGMSQWGAQGMAEEGYTYVTILRHYYQGTYVGYYEPYLYSGSIEENIASSAPSESGTESRGEESQEATDPQESTAYSDSGIQVSGENASEREKNTLSGVQEDVTADGVTREPDE